MCRTCPDQWYCLITCPEMKKVLDDLEKEIDLDLNLGTAGEPITLNRKNIMQAIKKCQEILNESDMRDRHGIGGTYPLTIKLPFAARRTFGIDPLYSTFLERQKWPADILMIRKDDVQA